MPIAYFLGIRFSVYILLVTFNFVRDFTRRQLPALTEEAIVKFG